MLRKIFMLSSLTAVSLSLGACASMEQSVFGPDIQTQCQTAITTAYNELHNPAHNTDATSLAWVKSANLLSSAQVQQSAHNYKACVQDAQHAQQLLTAKVNASK